MPFFQGFTLDTLLGCISCMLGIIALIAGTKAYKRCTVLESSFNDAKEFKDNSCDKSQRANGDIINLSCDADVVAKITASNLEASLRQMYALFEEQANNNLQRIIEQTKMIVQEQKPNLAGLTKVDWINVYFEYAKNTSDTYLQGKWAKVLARELEVPGSFSYKTLDVLKNLSSEDFLLFEKMISLQMEGFIFQRDIYTRFGIKYIDIVRLSEYGLLNTGNSEKIFSIVAHGINYLIYGEYVIVFENQSDNEVKLKYPIYLMTTVANELLMVSDVSLNMEYAKDCVNMLKEKNKNKNVLISLHKIDHWIGDEFMYYEKDLCS